MNEKPTPRLMELPADGAANKPDELDGLPITITDAMSTMFPDGRESAKWVVKLPSGETKIYWAAGQNPTLQVRDWFRNNPRTPLYCRLFRRTNQYGTAVWCIEQRDAEEGAENTEYQQANADQQLTMSGMPG